MLTTIDDWQSRGKSKVISTHINHLLQTSGCYLFCSSSPPMAKMFVLQTATLRYARRYIMLATVNHVPVSTPVTSNTRTTSVAEPSLSGSLLRYTAPPPRRSVTRQLNRMRTVRSYTYLCHSGSMTHGTGKSADRQTDRQAEQQTERQQKESNNTLQLAIC